jgi:hypothetical protein
MVEEYKPMWIKGKKYLEGYWRYLNSK